MGTPGKILTLIMIPITIVIIGFVHLINWALSKGVIWVMSELFNINWYEKFWVVYVAIILFSAIFKIGIRK